MELIRIHKILKVQDIFTFLNAAFGVIAIILAMQEKFTYSAIMILAAVVMDFMDGKVARMTKSGPHAFGKELDSLADSTSFGVASAVFGFMYLSAASANSLFSIIALTVFVLCGIGRLARFNITEVKGFEGMPITMNGIVIPAIYFAGVPAHIFPYIYILSALLMISSIRFRKI
ncbi:MAG: CDP-diacylglycerol--serine O-phosphatidyltransferase [Candidatus Woesearchaeota archaeon]